MALSSCSSTDDNFYGDLEAMGASEIYLDENTIPPWVEEADSNLQVDAGDRTPTYQQYPIPEPGETIEDTSGGFFSRQQQPEIVLDPPDWSPVDPIATTTTSTTSTTSSTKPKKKTPKITKPSILVYKVRRGDNLSVIAQRCGTTVSAIRRVSGIKGDLIYAGQTIKVPYTPKAKRHIDSSGRSGSSSSSSSTGRTYTIRSGDTISGIAARYGVGYKTVLKLNNMSEADARRLRPGQKIKIPNR